METKLQFTGSVTESGEITLPQNFKRDVLAAFAGKEIEVTVERKRKKRSLNQNAYYWGIIVAQIHAAMNQSGENVEPNEVHEFLKFRFLRVQKIDEETAELIYEYGRSTQKLNTVEFALYLDNCIQFAAQYLNIVIPPPYTCTDEYMFPETAGKLETRVDYIDRIKECIEMVFDTKSLIRYFNQVSKWENDMEIKQAFRARYDLLRAETD